VDRGQNATEIKCNIYDLSSIKTGHNVTVNTYDSTH